MYHKSVVVYLSKYASLTQENNKIDFQEQPDLSA